MYFWKYEGSKVYFDFALANLVLYDDGNPYHYIISCFVDLEKAYDRVDRVKLFESFALQLGLDLGTVRLL